MRLARWSWPVVLLCCACGGGGGVADLSGTWWLTPHEGGVTGDALHLTMVQTGSALSATVTCRADFPPGTGSWDGTTFTLAFEFGPGAVLSLVGSGVGGDIAGTFSDPEGGTGAFVLTKNNVLLDCADACTEVLVTPFVDVDFTELAKIEEISLFRSSAGHSYVDGCETCRSMKHYFAPFLPFRVNGAVEVRSPVDGLVLSVTPEGHGASPGILNKQVRIRSSLRPEVTFILFHVDLASATTVAGAAVTAGQPLGHARMYYDDLLETAHDFDIGVRVHTPFGDRYVSWFSVVTDALFATYTARGVPNRGALVLTQAARDADPLTCMDDAFTSVGALPAWFLLDPP